MLLFHCIGALDCCFLMKVDKVGALNKGGKSITAHMFWAKGPISELEYLCMKSFVDHGYRLLVWSYDDGLDLPPQAKLCDANGVIGESKLFLNRQGSYAGFSDYFRYKVLNRHGGLYADTDVIAVRSAQELPEGQFLVTEHSKQDTFKSYINGNVIYNPNPSKGNVIDLALAYSRRFPKEDIQWSEIGPALLSAIVSIYPRHGFAIQPPEFANPIPWWECPQKLLQDDFSVLDDRCFFFHCYNETWKRAGIDKNKAIRQKGSLINKLLF